MTVAIFRKRFFRRLRDDALLPLKRLTVIVAGKRCKTCFVVGVGSISAAMGSDTFFKKSLQDNLHALRRHQDASIQVVFYVRHAVKKNGNRTFDPPCTAVFRKTNPAYHSTVLKKLRETTNLCANQKNGTPTTAPYSHQKVCRPKKLWSERRGSNSRHPPWEGGALPSELRSPNHPYSTGNPKKRQYRFLTSDIVMKFRFFRMLRKISFRKFDPKFQRNGFGAYGFRKFLFFQKIKEIIYKGCMSFFTCA